MLYTDMVTFSISILTTYRPTRHIKNTTNNLHLLVHISILNVITIFHESKRPFFRKSQFRDKQKRLNDQ